MTLLTVDLTLMVFIVFLRDVLPVRHIEELVSVRDHFLEEVIRFTAILHRLTEQILRIGHHLVTILVFLVIVIAKRIFQLVIEIVSLVGAANDVVSVILLLVLIGVQETSVPLS